MTTKEAEGERKRIFDAIGAFLFEHQLDPSPANYMLVHKLVTQSSPLAVAAIGEATGDGIRLSQREADRIIGEIGGEAGSPLPYAQAAIDEARRQMGAFESMVADTRADVETYGRDLETGARQLQAGPTLESVAELVRVTGAMLERTRAAEKRLEAAIVEAKGLREKLAGAEEEARRDTLTGLPNRRAFETRYAELLAAGVPVTIALCDVDRFKAINDSHGHGVGDRVLRSVAHILNGACDRHMVARYGGEEFVVLFPGLTAAEAAEIVDGARVEIAARHFKLRENDAPLGRVTISAGVVASTPGESDEALLLRADALLYRAKDRGRNRVEIEGID